MFSSYLPSILNTQPVSSLLKTKYIFSQEDRRLFVSKVKSKMYHYWLFLNKFQNFVMVKTILTELIGSIDETPKITFYSTTYCFNLIGPYADSVYKLTCPSVCISLFGNHASRLTRDLWSKGVLLILKFQEDGIFFQRSWMIFVFFKNLKLGFWVFASHPTVHSGEVSRGRVCGCGCLRK